MKRKSKGTLDFRSYIIPIKNDVESKRRASPHRQATKYEGGQQLLAQSSAVLHTIRFTYLFFRFVFRWTVTATAVNALSRYKELGRPPRQR